MYNVILCAISLLGTKHINHEFEFAITKDLCIIRITHVTQLSNCYCNALNSTINNFFKSIKFVGIPPPPTNIFKV